MHPAPPLSDGREAAVRAAFAQQAVWCERLGSPFTARLCATLAERLDRNTAIGTRVLDWPGVPDSGADALPLRLAGGLNALVRAGHAPGLAELYPPHDLPEPETVWRSVRAVLEAREADLAPWLDRAPQTNEVARSAVLMAGLLHVAAHTRQPVALLELGASAGLNLVLDHYAYRLGGLPAGRAGSALTLAPAWEGPDPPQADLRVARRRGVDLAPLDAADPADRVRLLAYVWPDQAERVARTGTALAIAADLAPPVDRGDAADWLDLQLAEEPLERVTRVVMHSVAFQYFPAATAGRIRRRMEVAGAGATEARPLAWLAYEADAEADGRTTLRVRLWPGGNDHRLAIADPHGRRVTWSGAPAGTA